MIQYTPGFANYTIVKLILMLDEKFDGSQKLLFHYYTVSLSTFNAIMWHSCTDLFQTCMTACLQNYGI